MDEFQDPFREGIPDDLGDDPELAALAHGAAHANETVRALMEIHDLAALTRACFALDPAEAQLTLLVLVFWLQSALDAPESPSSA